MAGTSPAMTKTDLVLGRFRCRQCILCRGNVAGSADGYANRAFGDPLDEAAQHLAGADLQETRHAMTCHIGHRLAPAHRAGDLLDQTAADLGGISAWSCP